MSGNPRSLLHSTRTLIDTLLGLLETRLELLVTEIEEEKARLLGMLMFGAAAFVLLCLGIIFGALMLTVLFWDEHRLLVLGLLCAGFLIAGGFALWATFRNIKSQERLLSATIAELKQDRSALRNEEQ